MPWPKYGIQNTSHKQNMVINRTYTQSKYVDPTWSFSNLVRWTESKRMTTVAKSCASFCCQPSMKTANDEAVWQWRLSSEELGEPRFQLPLRWLAPPRLQEPRSLRRQTRPHNPSSLLASSMPAAKHAGSRAPPREMQSPACRGRRRMFQRGGSSIRLADSARWGASTFTVSAWCAIV
jgi:hypothetical protein